MSPDGQRFILAVDEADEESGRLDLVLVENWFEELNRLVPVD